MLRLSRLAMVRLAAHPVRSVLVILTLALGTTVVALAFSLRVSIERLARVAMPERGIRVVIANGQADRSGLWDWELPGRFSEEDGAELAVQYPLLTTVTPYASLGWQSVQAAGRTWRLRKVAGTGAEYASIMGIEVIAGSFFTAADVENAERLVVVSESAALALFGGIEQAIGQQIEAATGMVFMIREGPGSGPESGMSTPTQLKSTYRITGVFRDPPRLKRDAYGIPEAIIPHSSQLPPGVATRLPIRTFVASSTESRLAAVEENVRAVMVSTYGEEVKVAIWEGDPDSPLGASLDNTRKGILRFSLMVGLLAVVILILSSFGVFSSLMAEGADSGREIGITRAVGASIPTVRLLVVAKAALLGLAGGALGVIGGAVLNGVATSVLGLLLDGVGVPAAEIGPMGLSPLALLAALAAAVASAVLFGLLPAALTARVSIVEAIRDS